MKIRSGGRYCVSKLGKNKIRRNCTNSFKEINHLLDEKRLKGNQPKK
jgi:hypothetical protein